MMECYSGKTLLVTGHTGFKGSWLCAWASTLGARVIGISDTVPTSPANFKVSKIDSLVEDHRVAPIIRKPVRHSKKEGCSYSGSASYPMLHRPCQVPKVI